MQRSDPKKHATPAEATSSETSLAIPSALTQSTASTPGMILLFSSLNTTCKRFFRNERLSILINGVKDKSGLNTPFQPLDENLLDEAYRSNQPTLTRSIWRSLEQRSQLPLQLETSVIGRARELASIWQTRVVEQCKILGYYMDFTEKYPNFHDKLYRYFEQAKHFYKQLLCIRILAETDPDSLQLLDTIFTTENRRQKIDAKILDEQGNIILSESKQLACAYDTPNENEVGIIILNLFTVTPNNKIKLNYYHLSMLLKIIQDQIHTTDLHNNKYPTFFDFQRAMMDAAIEELKTNRLINATQDTDYRKEHRLRRPFF